jgi:hypothetical protein
MSLTTHLSISGQYNLVVSRNGQQVSETGWFDNLILDAGLDKIGNAATGVINYAQVGTGTTAPANTQTSLSSYLASTSSSISGASSYTNEGSPNYRTTHTFSLAFAQGAVVGNISEVGVGWQSASGGLFSRALIVDGGGSPTTITLTSIDQLTVFYRLRIAPPITDGTGSVTLGGTSYSYTMRACVVGSFLARTGIFNTTAISNTYDLVAYPATTTSLGAITSQPAGSTVPGTPSATAYTNGNYYRDYTLSFSTTQGNTAGGIGALRFGFGQFGDTNFQCLFPTPIPKDNTKVLTLNIRLSWARG